jgi:hypothetical protein
VNLFINAAVMIIFLVFLGRAAWRGWRQAGLFSIGLSTTLALAFFHGLAVPPINSPDLGILAVLAGLVFSLLIFAFARGRSSRVRGIILGVIGMLNLSLVWLPVRLWAVPSETMSPTPSLMALGAFISGLLLAGPLFGLLGLPLRHALHRYWSR